MPAGRVRLRNEHPLYVRTWKGQWTSGWGRKQDFMGDTGTEMHDDNVPRRLSTACPFLAGLVTRWSYPCVAQKASGYAQGQWPLIIWRGWYSQVVWMNEKKRSGSVVGWPCRSTEKNKKPDNSSPFLSVTRMEAGQFCIKDALKGDVNVAWPGLDWERNIQNEKWDAAQSFQLQVQSFPHGEKVRKALIPGAVVAFRDGWTQRSWRESELIWWHIWVTRQNLAAGVHEIGQS